ncbi:aspartate carbamoyltransferase catalytic subunit [bacterium]|nr:aspartate carbamoyltransferase catalytic subunit [bacterium]
MSLKSKNLLGIEQLSKGEIFEILNAATSFRKILDRPIKKVPTLRGITVANLFFEDSTRTRTSFELAEKRLSAETVNFSASTSSLKKGESLRDTVENIEAMQVDIVVMRHSAPGAPNFLARRIKSAVINAGDGCHEHPTQALLDVYTMREYFPTFEGLRVVIVGDIKHSRVAGSDIRALKKLGASVAVCGPRTLLPIGIEKLGAEVYSDLNKAIKGANVLYLLRLQLERQHGGYIPSLREYTQLYGIDVDKLKLLSDDYIVMHPGPMNRGVEITQEVADHERAVILEQVTNGVAVRMAILYLSASLIRDLEK